MNKHLLQEFKPRVYGILKKNDRYLVSHESYSGVDFCKFPGGGLELGESSADCLKREIKEELGVEVETLEQHYFCDLLVQNRFNPSQQVIGLYYHFTVADSALEEISGQLLTSFKQGALTHVKREWLSREELLASLSFEMDQMAASHLIE